MYNKIIDYIPLTTYSYKKWLEATITPSPVTPISISFAEVNY